MLSQPVDVPPVASPVFAKVQLQSSFSVIESFGFSETEKRTLLVSDVSERFDSVPESTLSGTHAKIDILKEDISKLTSSAGANFLTDVSLNSSLELHGANESRDDVFGRGFEINQFDFSVDRDELAKDKFADAWDSFSKPVFRTGRYFQA